MTLSGRFQYEHLICILFWFMISNYRFSQFKKRKKEINFVYNISCAQKWHRH